MSACSDHLQTAEHKRSTIVGNIGTVCGRLAMRPDPAVRVAAVFRPAPQRADASASAF